MVVVDRGLCLTSGALVLKLVCWQKVNFLNAECDSNYNKKNSTDLDCLKMFIKFYLCAEK